MNFILLSKYKTEYEYNSCKILPNHTHTHLPAPNTYYYDTQHCRSSGVAVLCTTAAYYLERRSCLLACSHTHWRSLLEPYTGVVLLYGFYSASAFERRFIILSYSFVQFLGGTDISFSCLARTINQDQPSGLLWRAESFTSAGQARESLLGQRARHRERQTKVLPEFVRHTVLIGERAKLLCGY